MSEEIQRVLIREVAAIGIALTQEQAEILHRYLRLIARWRRRARLTTVIERVKAARIHVADSLLCLHADLPAQATVIDVGSGAGFPGVPLAIVRPDLRVTLLEAESRKAAFLELAAGELALDVQVVWARAEDAGRDGRWRELFDIAVARAVAPLGTLCELALPFVRVGGKAVLLKGPSVRREIAGEQQATRMLGGGEPEIADARLAGGERRVLVTIAKRSATPPEFPRRAGVPRRKPIQQCKGV